MSLVWKISGRNLFKHKIKSFIIGGIIVLGAVLMTIGNAVVSGMEKGMSENIVDSFTGDLVIVSKEEKNDDVIFGMSTAPIPLLEEVEGIEKELENNGIIEKYLFGNKGYALILNEDGDLVDTYIMGVEIEKYREMFPDNIEIIKGEFLKEGEKGAMLTKLSRDLFYDYAGLWYMPEGEKIDKEELPEDSKELVDKIRAKSDIVFMGSSDKNDTTDVRTNIKGIVKYKSLNKIWGYYNFVDMESYRECFGYLEDTTEEKIQDEELDLIDFDNMFSEVEVLNENESVDYSMDTLKEDIKREDDFIKTDNKTYNIIFVKLKDSFSKEEINDILRKVGERDLKDVGVVKKIKIFLFRKGLVSSLDKNMILEYLNKDFEEKGLNIRAIDWKKSIGVVGSIAGIIKFALNLFVFFLFLIAGIIIMNTISMSIMERSSEIAMMRAVGARRGFIRKMLFVETLILVFVFGLIGIGLGDLIVLFIQNLGYSTENDMLQLVFGGDKLMPLIRFGDFILESILLFVIVVLSMIYPSRVANKITPLDAIARD